MKHLCFTLLLLAGCANPKYVTPDEGGGGSDEKATADVCAARFEKGGCVGWKWENRGTTKTFGTFLLKTGRANLGDGSLFPQDPAGDINVVLWMPDMDHGSSPVRVERVDVGTFRISKVSLPMGGHWQFHVQVKNGDEVQDTAIIDYTF